MQNFPSNLDVRRAGEEEWASQINASLLLLWKRLHSEGPGTTAEGHTLQPAVAHGKATLKLSLTVEYAKKELQALPRTEEQRDHTFPSEAKERGRNYVRGLRSGSTVKPKVPNAHD